MTKNTLKKIFPVATVMLTVALCCAVMAVVETVLELPYFAKSAVKAALFLLCPIIFFCVRRDGTPKAWFRAEKKHLLMSLAAGTVLYGLILGAYFLLRGVIDFSAVTARLAESDGVTRDNFPFVALYISVVNSLLEEFFFRGFAFLTLRRLSHPWLAHGFSAVAFAIYHIAILDGWFTAPVLVLAIAGLAAAGIFFNAIDAKGGSLYPSWIIHLSANLAINTIGFILFAAV